MVYCCYVTLRSELLAMSFVIFNGNGETTFAVFSLVKIIIYIAYMAFTRAYK